MLLAAEKWPFPTREFYFHPVRKWRFDFAWQSQRIAVELEGGAMAWPVVCDSCGRHVYRKNKRTGRKERVYAAMGRHTRSAGIQGDCDKYNAASELGWRVLRFTTKHVTESPVQMIEQITRLLAEGPKVEVEAQGNLFGAASR